MINASADAWLRRGRLPRPELRRLALDAVTNKTAALEKPQLPLFRLKSAAFLFLREVIAGGRNFSRRFHGRGQSFRVGC